MIGNGRNYTINDIPYVELSGGTTGTTATADTTGHLRVGVIRINRVGIAVRFVGDG